MSQIEFGGKGDPIPTMALPEMDDDVPFTVLIFTDDANFGAAYYRSLGFTHYEAWCVGGVGGRGGDGTRLYNLPYERTRSSVPQDIWDLRLEYLRVMDFFTSGEWDHIYHYGPSTELPNNGMITVVQHEEFYNPNHELYFYTYKNPVLIPEIQGMGGGGGGGGLQKVFGELVDLSDLVPVVVGKAGADAGYAQTVQLGSFTPEMDSPPYTINPSDPYPTDRLHELGNFFHGYQRSYPGEHTAFTGNPVKGEDGGASSFGDEAQASGGKGGEPGMVWDGSKFIPKGHGGAGGVGGQLTAGGGAAGSISQTADGANGVWFFETGIGQGGGGGKGGLSTTPATNIPFYRPPIPNPATAGGQGSYSFADTSVYGQRQYRQPWSYIRPVAGAFGTATWTFVPTTDPTNMVTPGSGGGARPTPNLKYGSRADGFSPNGVVMLRLAKVI